MTANVQEWVPHLTEHVLVISDKGIFKPYVGQEGEVVNVMAGSRQATIVVNRQTLYACYPQDIAPLDVIAEPKGSIAELLTRITRLAEQLKSEMRAQAVVGFGDGARWRADFAEGKLVIREVKDVAD